MKLVREFLALAGLAFQMVTSSAWRNPPDRVPTHFGFSGRPDAWGGHGSLIVLPLVTLGLWLMLTVLARFPQAFNYPVEVTAGNRLRLESIAIGMLGWLKAEIVWGFAYIQWATIRDTGLGVAFLPIGLGLTAATIVIAIILMRRV